MKNTTFTYSSPKKSPAVFEPFKIRILDPKKSQLIPYNNAIESKLSNPNYHLLCRQNDGKISLRELSKVIGQQVYIKQMDKNKFTPFQNVIQQMNTNSIKIPNQTQHQRIQKQQHIKWDANEAQKQIQQFIYHQLLGYYKMPTIDFEKLINFQSIQKQQEREISKKQNQSINGKQIRKRKRIFQPRNQGQKMLSQLSNHIQLYYNNTKQQFYKKNNLNKKANQHIQEPPSFRNKQNSQLIPNFEQIKIHAQMMKQANLTENSIKNVKSAKINRSELQSKCIKSANTEENDQIRINKLKAECFDLSRQIESSQLKSFQEYSISYDYQDFKPLDYTSFQNQNDITSPFEVNQSLMSQNEDSFNKSDYYFNSENSINLYKKTENFTQNQDNFEQNSIQKRKQRHFNKNKLENYRDSDNKFESSPSKFYQTSSPLNLTLQNSYRSQQNTVFHSFAY